MTPGPDDPPPYRKDSWRRLARENPPKRAATERVADFLEISGGFDEATARDQASRCIQCPHPTCTEGCPLSNRIPEWLALTAEGQFMEAAEVSRATSNMPEICSRICPQEQLCEGACILNGKAEPVSIGAIERFINEYAFAHGLELDAPPPSNGFKIAVVGSGPGGLSCAAELAKLGYAVTIFESQMLPGGLLVNGIPAFKLEKTVVMRRIDLLKKRGVEFRLGVTLGKDVGLGDLREQYDAVFLAIGAYQAKPLRMSGEDLDGVCQALPFLIQKNIDFQLDIEEIEVSGKRVVVLGGGDTAMDCLRTAVRGGATDVACVYRRDLANMPGNRKEYANAVEEGARFLFLTNPVELLANDAGHVTHLRCVRMELGEPDAGGRRRPIAVEGSEFDLEADVVLVAFGFDPIEFPPGSELAEIERDKWGGMIVDDNKMTNIPGVYAGGDIVRGASLVVHAVRDARTAAHAIHRHLRS